MSIEDNLATDYRLGEAINAHDLDAIEQGFAVDAIDHDPAPGQALGAVGFRGYFAALFDAFPDLRTDVESTVANDDHVAIAYRLTGTHQGDFLGVPATGRQIRARGMQIARYRNGRIVERWGSTDELGILAQLTRTHPSQ